MLCFSLFSSAVELPVLGTESGGESTLRLDGK